MTVVIVTEYKDVAAAGSGTGAPTVVAGEILAVHELENEGSDPFRPDTAFIHIQAVGGPIYWAMDDAPSDGARHYIPADGDFWQGVMVGGRFDLKAQKYSTIEVEDAS